MIHFVAKTLAALGFQAEQGYVPPELRLMRRYGSGLPEPCYVDVADATQVDNADDAVERSRHQGEMVKSPTNIFPATEY